MSTQALFYDTETSGLPLFSEPSDDPRQPHIVQLAAYLVDMASRSVVASMDVIVRPDGWDIPEDVEKIHGITTDRARAVGIPEDVALGMFRALHGGRLRIAHNESFDARIVRIALKRYADDAAADAWKDMPAECTQRLATPILNLPPTQKMLAAGRNHAKSANLSEAFRHFTGSEHHGAHSAARDVLACMAVYFAIQDMQP